MAAPPFSTATQKRREYNLRDRRKMFTDRRQCPSFSSTLLEKIYDSIDEGRVERTPKSAEPASYRDEKLSKNKTLYEAMFLERKSVVKMAPPEKYHPQRRQLYEEIETRPRNRHRDFDQDVSCFSTSSCSSESSSGPFSSSESESVVGVKTGASCFVPARLRPVRTKGPPEKTEDALFQERNSLKSGEESGDSGVRRSRQWKLFEQLKKSNQPISPGGRLVNFVHSLFSSSAGNTNRGRSIRKKSGGGDIRSQDEEANREREMHSSQPSTCSSVSSFVRTSRDKHSASNRELTQKNGARRTVRFHPVSLLVDADSRYHGNKLVDPKGGGEECSGLMPISVPKAWTIGRTLSGRTHQDSLRRQLPESKRHDNPVEAPREVLSRDSSQQSQPTVIETMVHSDGYRPSKDEDYCNDNDDVFSCSSSDLFDLPLYETTRLDSNWPDH